MIADNPIGLAEYKHQQYIINNSRSGWMWIALAMVMLIPGLVTAFLVTIYTLLGGVPSPNLTIDTITTIPQALETIGWLSMIIMNIALFFVLILIAFGLSLNSVTREKTNHTWHLLLLTNVNAYQMVRGKWWASVLALRGDYVFLTILRLGMVTGLVVIYSVMSNASNAPAFLEPARPVTSADIFMLIVFVSAFSGVEAIYNPALGLLIALADLSGSVAMTLYIMIRVFLGYLSVWWVMETANRILYYADWSYVGYGVAGPVAALILLWLTLHLAEIVAVRRSQVTPAEQIQL